MLESIQLDFELITGALRLLILLLLIGVFLKLILMVVEFFLDRKTKASPMYCECDNNHEYYKQNNTPIERPRSSNRSTRSSSRSHKENNDLVMNVATNMAIYSAIDDSNNSSSHSTGSSYSSDSGSSSSSYSSSDSSSSHSFD
jgi:hypothetical protein